MTWNAAFRHWDHGTIDPRITVYIGFESPINQDNFAGEGHIYIFRGGDYDVPVRMAEVYELDTGSGVNPEIWDTHGGLLKTEMGRWIGQESGGNLFNIG